MLSAQWKDVEHLSMEINMISKVMTLIKWCYGLISTVVVVQCMANDHSHTVAS